MTDKPGHYLEPVFSPDGAKIVYTKGTGGYLRSTAWSADPGLYQVRGGRRKVGARHRDGLLPALRQGLRPRLLRQDRGRRRPDRAREARPRLDRARRLGPARALPLRARHRVRDLARRQVARVPRGLQRLRRRPSSRPAAASTSVRRARPSPSRRSRRTPARTCASPATRAEAHWSFGPQLFERDLKEAFAFLPGSPEKLPDPPVVGRDIGFNAAVDEPIGCRRHHRRPRRHDERRRGHRGRRRRRPGQPDHRGGPAGERSPFPAGAKTVDATGKTVLPGFIDAHWHGAVRLRRHPAAAELAHRRLARLRRHDGARSLERHRRGLLGGGAHPRGPAARPAHLLDRHDPLRRRRRLHDDIARPGHH